MLALNVNKYKCILSYRFTAFISLLFHYFANTEPRNVSSAQAQFQIKITRGYQQIRFLGYTSQLLHNHTR